MLTEMESIIYAFQKNFGYCINRKIALYGDSQMILCIIRKFPEHLFAGEVVCGRDHVLLQKKTTDIEDMESLGVELVITVVKPHELGDAYLRLEMVCKAANILLYHIDGTNLVEHFKMVNPVPLTEHDAIEYSFRKCFWRFKHKNIILYGTGHKTAVIIKSLPDYRILGVMDKNKESGMFCEKPILSYEQAVSSNVDLIIAIAKKESLQYIYNRLYNFCNTHHICLVDEEGENLFKICNYAQELIEKNVYFDLNEDSLKKEIEAHDVISFGIFDTLLMYLTLQEDDALYIANHKKNISLGNMIVPREKMVEMYKYAVKLRKKIYLISDSMLPKEQLIDILKKYGLGSDAELILASEYGMKKEQGLIGVVLEESGSNVLHIGSSRKRDELPAQEFGFDVFTIKSARDMLGISSYARVRTILTSINERSMIGLVLARIFNNPFALYGTNGKVRLDTISDFGYLYLAPLLTDFILWMRNHLQKHNYENILFASRDGYLIQKLYSFMREKLQEMSLPEGQYFLTSRRVATNISVKTQEDIKWLFSLPYIAEPENILMDKFFLEKEQVPQFIAGLYKNPIEYALANCQLIYQESSRQMENYMKYIHNIKIKNGRCYALFDLVSSGTSQYYLSKELPFDIEGVYLCWYDVEEDEKRKLPIYSRHVNDRLKGENSFSVYAGGTYLYANYALLEPFITSPQPSVYGFDSEGNPIYGNDLRSENEVLMMNRVQESIEEYFKQYISILWVDGIPISERIPDVLFSLKDSKYTKICCEELFSLVNRDDFGLANVELRI